MKKAVLALLSIAIISGCRQNDPASFMAFRDVIQAKEFPVKVTLKNAEKVPISTIGAKDIRIQDSLLFIAANRDSGFISIFSLPSLERKGSFIKKGNGPGELLFFPFFSNVSFCNEGGNMIISLFDARGKSFNFYVNESMKDGTSCISSGIQLPSAQIMTCYDLGNGRFFCRSLSGNMDAQRRYIHEETGDIETQAMGRLNKAVVPKSSDGLLFNALSSFTQINHEKMIAVEASTMMNTINVYKIDSLFAKTICIGKKVDKIKDICKDGAAGLKQKNFDLKTYENGFGVLNSDGESNSPKSVLLFDWECRPVAKFELTNAASAFDIDWINHALYTYDMASETLLKYDISDYITTKQ